MQNDHRKFLKSLLILVFVISTVMLGYQLIDQQKGSTSYNKAEDLLIQHQDEPVSPSTIETIDHEYPPTNNLPQIWVASSVEGDAVLDELKNTDFTPLKEVNQDVIGWITIPQTTVDYPLLQGTDNHYYLKYTWDNQRSNVGAIYLDSTVNPDLSDFHTIIYGHNLLNNTMFSAIPQYCDQSYFEANPYIYLSTDQDTYRYEVYSAYEADVISYTYRLGFDNTEDKNDFISMTKDLSVIETDITPLSTDRIITLSTCMSTGEDTRWVVHARLEMTPIS